MKYILAKCTLLAAMVLPAMAADVKLGLNGIDIDAGNAGTFVLNYPKAQKDGKAVKVAVKTVGDKSAVLKYEGGGQIRLDLRDGGVLQLYVSGFKPDSVRLDMTVTGHVRGKLKFSANDAEPQDIPVDYAGNAFLFKGDAKKFALTAADGSGLAIHQPHGFQQFQDNREWKTQTFTWFTTTQVPWNGDEAYLVYAVTGPKDKVPAMDVKPVAGAEAPKAAAKIDRFGQLIDKQFPGKVTDVAELKADVAADEQYYGSLNPPATDTYGGFPGTGEKYGLKKTGFFHVGQINGKHVLVTPDGNAFFQLGVCSSLINIDDYTKIEGRHQIYQWLPPFDDPKWKTAYRQGQKSTMSFYIANVIEKFDRPFDQKDQARRIINRLRKWGFNSAGAFSVNKDVLPVAEEMKFPYVANLPMGSAPSLPIRQIWDPFAPGVEEKLDAAFAKGVAPKKDDPLLIGYFHCNEPDPEDIPKIVPTLPASKYAAKGKLVSMLKDKYGSIEAFNKAWAAEFVSFDELGDAKLLIKTAEANADVQAFFEVFLEARYSMVHRLLKKHDPNHLFIGDRWTHGSANNPTIVRIAGKYMDVVSINHYAYALDPEFLKRVYEWSGGKPQLLSEFHYGSREQGLSGGVRQVANQTERGLAYRNYVEQAAATGFVVGVQWFSAIDQAATSRFFDGENHNIGLINVADRPYKDMLAEMMKTNYDLLPVILGERPAYAYDDPRFQSKRGGRKTVQIARLVKPFQPDGNRSEWPALPAEGVGADALVTGEHANGFDASFRMAWDDNNLYVYAELHDPTPMVNDRKDESIWSADSVEIFIGPENGVGGGMTYQDRQILLRGATPGPGLANAYFANADKQYTAQVALVGHPDGKGYTMEAAIPLESLGIKPAVGMEVAFNIAFNDAGIGRRQLIWNGDRASKDRGAWGKAAFTE